MGKTQLVPAGYVVTKNGLGGSVWVPNKIETPIWHDVLEFFDPFFLAKTGVWQKTDITTRSGVKKYAGWCTRIPKS